MYTLRSVMQSERTKVYNQSLGENYSVIHKKTERELQKGVEKASSNDYDVLAKGCITNENTYAILVANDGKLTIPLFRNQDYFIMTERGKTFEKL